MVRINALRGNMVENGVNVQCLAKELGVDQSTVYRWFAEPDNITVGSACKIGVILNLRSDEMRDLFFAA